MLTIPLITVIAIIITIGAVKWGPWSLGPVIGGLILGILLSASPAGPKMLQGIKNLSNSGASITTSMVGGHK